MISGLVTGTTLALAYVFVGLRGIQGTIDPGGVVLVIGAFSSVAGTLGQISSTFVAVDQHTRFLGDYFSFLKIRSVACLYLKSQLQFLMDPLITSVLKI
jgi:hypothetical protein